MKALCALVAMLLWLVSDGAHAADVTASVSITRTGFVLNRSTKTYDATATLTNTSQASFTAPMTLIVSLDAPSVKVNNKAGVTTEGKPYLQVPLSLGTLNQGQSVAVVLKIDNPSQVRFTALLTVDAQLSGDTLPPDPGPAGKLTVAGIDSNHNGVRDDVEIFIARAYGKSHQAAAALNQFAVATQISLLTASTDEANMITDGVVKAAECLDFLGIADDSWKSVLAIILNTAPRIKAYASYEAKLAGGAFPSNGYENWKLSCKFDVDAQAD